MRRNNTFWILSAGALILLLLNNMQAFKSILSSFLPNWEGFKSAPYWDYKQWSWGYGTRVPGSDTDPYKNPGGTISRNDAMQEALKHINSDYLYLKPFIKTPLNNNQWAALLSFSYNMGPGNADNLVANINNHNLTALEMQWKQYINAGGVPKPDLISRRNAEWDLYIS